MPPIRRARYSERERAEWLENKKAQAAYAAAQAEAEAAQAAAAAEQQMENTESNFPTLSTAHPVAHLVLPPNGYANLARDWATAEETAKKVVPQQQTQDYYIPRPIFMDQPVTRRPQFTDWADERRREEEEAESAPPVQMNEADRGWTVVQNRKSRKVKREMTFDEMDARERQLGDGGGEDGEDYQFNDDLYESNRHDHH